MGYQPILKALKPIPILILKNRPISPIQVFEPAIAVVAKVDAVPAVALITNPAWRVVRGGDVFASRQKTQVDIFVTPGVAFGRCEIRMNGFVR